MLFAEFMFSPGGPAGRKAWERFLAKPVPVLHTSGAHVTQGALGPGGVILFPTAAKPREVWGLSAVRERWICMQ